LLKQEIGRLLQMQYHLQVLVLRMELLVVSLLHL